MSVKIHLDKEGVTSGRMCFTLSAGSLINQQKTELGFTFPVMYLLAQLQPIYPRMLLLSLKILPKVLKHENFPPVNYFVSLLLIHEFLTPTILTL